MKSTTKVGVFGKKLKKYIFYYLLVFAIKKKKSEPIQARLFQFSKITPPKATGKITYTPKFQGFNLLFDKIPSYRTNSSGRFYL